MEVLVSSASLYYVPIALAVIVLASYAALSRKEQASVSSIASTPIKEHLSLKLKKASNVLDQFPLKQKLSLQTRVANAVTAEDLLYIFSDYRELEHLRLATDKITSDESLSLANEQAFKDLVRESVLINETAIDPIERDSKDFRTKFQGRIQDAISKHVADLKMRDLIATHICCHLSRTRAGGDSFFAIQDIFATPQFMITAAAAYTHPPTSLLVTTDGWAVITTTSNFDVYCRTDLSGEDDNHPEPLVTISALVEEAVPLSKHAKDAWAKFIEVNGRVEDPSEGVEERHAAALPVSRTLRLTCTLPLPSMYYGYAEKSFSVCEASMTSATSGRSSPANIQAVRSTSWEDSSGSPTGSSRANGVAYLRQPSPSALASSKGGVLMQSMESVREAGAFQRSDE